MIYLNNNTEVQLVSIPRGTVAASSSVTQYATEEYVDNAIEEAISGITGVNYTAGENIQIVNDVISVTGMPDTSEFVTSGDVETQINNAISGITGGTTYEAGENIQISGNVISVTGMPDTSEFVTSGDVQTQINDSISGITGGTEYSAGTNIKIEDYVISVTGLPTSNTAFTNDAGYVNSGQVNTQIENAVSGLSPYTAGTNIDINNNVISVTGISDFVTSGDVQTQISDSISGKQDTLVSGTNIKTINNQNILGSGNIEITAETGEKVVELTMAEYTALTAYSQDTTYIITDAPAIDLDSLATTAEVATKADKVSVTANTNRLFPRWNTQGIITGSTGNSVYEQSLNINGTSKTMLQTTNSSFGNIYAPTSAGSAGQILQSNGSGAPSWSTFKMWFGTQTQYDAITTKDSSTIYFVKED